MHSAHLPRLILALACAALLSSPPAFGCAVCDHAVSSDWSSQGIPAKPGFSADLNYGYLNQDQQRYGSGTASAALVDRQLNAGQEIEAFTRTQTVTATLAYTDEDWGVSLLLPYVSRTHGTYGATAPLGSGYSTSSDSGIGDIKLLGRYSGFSENGSSGLTGGFKLPTGNTSALFSQGAAAGRPLDAGLQIGTGSTDLILGGYTTGVLADEYGWFMQASAQHAIATKQALGNLDYRPGDTYALSLGIRTGGLGATFTPMLQLNLIRRQADQGAQTVPTDPLTGAPVSGGTLAYLSPGVSVRLGGGLSMYGFLQLPVYQQVNSLQITPRYMLSLGMHHSFD